MSIYKKFHVTVGCDGINSLDDTVDIDLPLSDYEIDAIVNGGIWQIGRDTHVGEEEYIECYAPEAWKRAIRLAGKATNGLFSHCHEEGYAVDVFLPEEISDIIWNSSVALEYKNTREDYKNISNKRWKQDFQTIKEEMSTGRWNDSIVLDTQCPGIWSGDAYSAAYSLNFFVKGKHKVSYGKSYEYKSKKIFVKMDTYYVSMETIEDICHKIEKRNILRVTARFISYEQIQLSGETNDSDEGVQYLVTFLDELTKVAKKNGELRFI